MVSCVSLCVCSAVYPVVCASRLEVYGGVCSVKDSLESGYIFYLQLGSTHNRAHSRTHAQRNSRYHITNINIQSNFDHMKAPNTSQTKKTFRGILYCISTFILYKHACIECILIPKILTHLHCYYYYNIVISCPTQEPNGCI